MSKSKPGGNAIPVDANGRVLSAEEIKAQALQIMREEQLEKTRSFLEDYNAICDKHGMEIIGTVQLQVAEKPKNQL